jgi:competence protein ComEC
LWYFSLGTEPPLWTGLGGLAALGIPGFLCRRKPVFYTLVPVLLVVLGFTAAQWRTWSVAAPALERKTYSVTLQGTVANVDPLPKSYRITLKDYTVTEGRIEHGAAPVQVRVKLKSGDTAEPAAGDIVSLRAVLQPIGPPVLPGAFDFQRYAFFQQLGATGYAIGDLEKVKPRAGGYIFADLRRAVRDRVQADVPDRDDAALIVAFMVGDSTGISQDTWNICRLAGIAHLIAISGSHFMMVGGVPFFLIRALLAAFPFIALRFPVKKIAAGFAIAASVFYMLLIGEPVPAERAVVSISVIMLAIMLDREPLSLRLASFSALLILLCEPESLPEASFQLSYAAVIGLVSFYEATRDWWNTKFRDKNLLRRWSWMLAGCAVTTFIASTATGPFALYHFARLPLFAGLAANMIAVPLSSFVTFPAGLLACLLMPFHLEKYPLWVTQKSLDVILYVAREVSTWPYGSWAGGAVPAWFLAPVTLGGLWLCFWRTKMRWLGLLPLAASVAMLFVTPKPDILVSGKADIFAVRDAQGKLWFSSAKGQKFLRREWLQLQSGVGDDYGLWPYPEEKEEDEDATPAPAPAPAAGGALTCTEAACYYRAKEQIVAFIRSPQALEQDCDGLRQGAELVLSNLTLEPKTCHGNVVIHDQWAAKDDGAEEIYLKPGGGFRIDSVVKRRGHRPWTRSGEILAP